MRAKSKKRDPLPEQFASYDEAGEFWDTHDFTDYLEFTTPVSMTGKLLKRHYEVELDPELAAVLQRRARKLKQPVRKLVSDLLRHGLAAM